MTETQRKLKSLHDERQNAESVVQRINEAEERFGAQAWMEAARSSAQEKIAQCDQQSEAIRQEAA